MTLPNKFRVDREQAVATYSYDDIASGTGTAVYYLCQETDSSDTGYFLTPDSSLYADSFYWEEIANSLNPSVSQEYDFDVMFNTPRVINGDIYANIAWYTTNAGNNGTMTITVEMKHYDGSTETTIGSAVSSVTITSTTPAVQGYKLLKITNTSKIKFRKGDILRASITLATTRTSDVTYSRIGTDPAGRALGTVTAQSKILVPFDLDL